MKVKSKFDIDTYLGKELQEWWEELHGKGIYEGKPRTGDRAELKKAKTVLDVILLPAFQNLVHDLSLYSKMNRIGCKV